MRKALSLVNSACRLVTLTTLTGANAAASAIEALQEQDKLSVISLQEHHA